MYSVSNEFFPSVHLPPIMTLSAPSLKEIMWSYYAINDFIEEAIKKNVAFCEEFSTENLTREVIGKFSCHWLPYSGEGGFAKVYKIEWKGKHVAMKWFSSTGHSSFLREIVLLR